jgi:hypothetical protein
MDRPLKLGEKLINEENLPPILKGYVTAQNRNI